MKTLLLEPPDPRWREYVCGTVHDFYHLPEYVALEAKRIGGVPFAVLAEEGRNGLLIPLIVKEFKEEWLGNLGGGRDAVSPYGYPGPLPSGNAAQSIGFLDSAIRDIIRRLRDADICALFVRMHTILSLPSEPFDCYGQLITHGETVLVDLACDEAELWRQTRPQVRNEINNLLKAGFSVRMSNDITDLYMFMDVYWSTMTRVGASKAYFFTREYFLDLFQALGGRLHVGLVEHGGKAAALGLFTETCGIVQYHLGATVDEYHRKSPSKLLLHHVRMWAKSRGNKYFHLGGGLGAQRDSLFNFKAGFSSLRARFHTWRVVCDAVTYQKAVQSWQDFHHNICPDDGRYFPSYRAQLQASIDKPLCSSGKGLSKE